MKYASILTFLFLLFFSATQAQPKSELISQSKKMAQAIIEGDTKTSVEYIFPKVIDLMGGREMAIETFENANKTLKEREAIIEKYDLAEFGDIVSNKGEMYASILAKTVLNLKGTRYYYESSLLAKSPDQGKRWYFIDAGNISDEALKAVCPDKPLSIVIVKIGDPIKLTGTNQDHPVKNDIPD